MSCVDCVCRVSDIFCSSTTDQIGSNKHNDQHKMDCTYGAVYLREKESALATWASPRDTKPGRGSTRTANS